MPYNFVLDFFVAVINIGKIKWRIEKMQNLFNSFNNLVDRRNNISKSLSSRKIKSRGISCYPILIACVFSFFILLKAIPL